MCVYFLPSLRTAIGQGNVKFIDWHEWCCFFFASTLKDWHRAVLSCLFDLCSPETKYKHKCFVNNTYFYKYFKKILDLEEHCLKRAAFKFGLSHTACTIISFTYMTDTLSVASFLAETTFLVIFLFFVRFRTFRSVQKRRSHGWSHKKPQEGAFLC
jgi:hypothetical protein